MNKYCQLAALAVLACTSGSFAQDHSQHTVLQKHSDGADHSNHTRLQAAPISHAQSVYHVDARWTTHHNTKMRLSELNGTPVIMAMMYGSCTTACPVLVHDVKRLYDALDPVAQQQIKLVMVSFDTDRDTPQALASYVQQYELNDDNWVFLKGPKEHIRTLATVLGVRYRQRPDGDFDHSNVITILNKDGVIAERIEGLSQPMEKPAQRINHLIHQ